MKTIAYGFVFISLLASHSAEAKEYERCELARKLKELGVNSIAEWMCIAWHESRWDTSMVGINGTVQYYGLFQIGGEFWCLDESNGMNLCDFECLSILHDVTSTDIDCIRFIFEDSRFDSWPTWEAYCEGHDIHQYTLGCFEAVVGGAAINGGCRYLYPLTIFIIVWRFLKN